MDRNVKNPGPDKSLPSREAASLEDALKVMAGAFDASPTSPRPLPDQRQFGKLSTFTPDETEQLVTLRDLVANYVVQPSPPRPLCLSVFGPPGSGKSFAVKQIRVEASPSGTNLKLPFTTINMTQVSNAGEVGRVLARIAGEQDEETVPIIFIDEFDAPQGGASYGWLKWFLAPMQDGEFLHEGATIRLKRAVYFFAGGTAATLAEFSQPDDVAAFKFAKGPDFISRLSGFLDVKGPNASPRESRRAVLFRKEFDDCLARNRSAARLRAGKGNAAPTVVEHLEPDPALLRALVEAGRYRHGARSIAAVVALSRLAADQGTFTWEHLPGDHLLQLHIDRGALDFQRIGGAIALSGYPAISSADAVASCWLDVARALWNEGATLAYAGRWGTSDGARLLPLLADELKKRAAEPTSDERRRLSPEPWLLNFLKNTPKRLANLDNAITQKERDRIGLRVVVESHLTKEELSKFAGNPATQRVIERFRRRLAVSEVSVARFAIGGALKNHGGRAPGIVEEVMLTLALGRPVYISGGFGGAAVDLGNLLGLAQLRTGEVPASFLENGIPDEELVAISQKLRPAPLTTLPVTPQEIATFLKGCAMGGRRWPDNGLSHEQNRALFKAQDGKEVARLVTVGLQRVFAKRG